MEASALQAPAGLTRHRTSIGAPLLRLRSDEQLVTLFRAGNDDAFRVIHDRYRQRLFAYARQMLPGSRQDAEDALQDVFVRAYSALRATDRELALRAWLYRVAHNRCIDELRRPPAPAPELIELVRSPVHDPIAEAERRESLRRLIEDVRRLPEAQRSALLMRELSGMSYAELASALDVSIPAVKSLLVRARVSLAQAIQARDTACADIREELILAHERGVRPNGTARRHLRDCAPCREFRQEVRGLSRQFAALAPAIGPLGLLANVLGFGSGAGGGAAGSAAATSAFSGGAVTGGGAMAGGVGHIATLLAAAAVTAGGAVEIQHSIASLPAKHNSHHARTAVALAPAMGDAENSAGSAAGPVAALSGYRGSLSGAVSANAGATTVTSGLAAGGDTLPRTPTHIARGSGSPPLGMAPSDSSTSRSLSAAASSDLSAGDGTVSGGSAGSTTGSATGSASTSPTSSGGAASSTGTGSTTTGGTSAGGSGSGTSTAPGSSPGTGTGGTVSLGGTPASSSTGGTFGTVHPPAGS